MCDRPCQTRYLSLTRMWHICTARKYSTVGCQTSRSKTRPSIRKTFEAVFPYLTW